MFSHIETDLDLSGISKGFVSINRDSTGQPTAERVSESSYDRPEAHVPLIDGRTLHAILGGRNEIKLTLISKHPSCMNDEEIGWINAKRMKDAIDANHGLFEFEGRTLAFVGVPRPLKRMLARAVFCPKQ